MTGSEKAVEYVKCIWWVVIISALAHNSEAILPESFNTPIMIIVMVLLQFFSNIILTYRMIALLFIEK